MNKNKWVNYRVQMVCCIVFFLAMGQAVAVTAFMDDFGDTPDIPEDMVTTLSESQQRFAAIKNAGDRVDFWKMPTRYPVAYTTLIEQVPAVGLDSVGEGGTPRPGHLAITTNNTGSTGNETGLISEVSSEFNFFEKRLKYSVMGIELDGESLNSASMMFVITANRANSSRLTVNLNGNRGFNIWTATTGQNVFLAEVTYEALEVPKNFDIELDATTYRITFEFAGGGLFFSGEHGLTIESWENGRSEPNNGDSAILIAAKSSARMHTTEFRVDAVSVDEISALSAPQVCN